MGDTSERRQARRQEYAQRKGQADARETRSINTDELATVGGAIHSISVGDCARVNALINHSSVRITLSTVDTRGPARVVSVKPSLTIGFLIVECDTIFDGRMILEVGGGVAFALKFQVR